MQAVAAAFLLHQKNFQKHFRADLIVVLQYSTLVLVLVLKVAAANLIHTQSRGDLLLRIDQHHSLRGCDIELFFRTPEQDKYPRQKASGAFLLGLLKQSGSYSCCYILI